MIKQIDDKLETYRRLNDPDGWDGAGIIRDVIERLEKAGDHEAAAVIRWLRGRWQSAQRKRESTTK